MILRLLKPDSRDVLQTTLADIQSGFPNGSIPTGSRQSILAKQMALLAQPEGEYNFASVS
ncbi:MAG: hypothetical protein WCS87_05645 [Methylococcaceae bacterium]